MRNLWDKLNDHKWVPRYGEVTIKYQDGIPVSITRIQTERLEPEPAPSRRKIPQSNTVSDGKSK